MEKEWMNAPLPPLSQSIVASGLVGGDYKIAQIPQSSTKKRRSSSTFNISSVKKSIPKIISQRTSKIKPPIDSDCLIDQESFSKRTAKTSRPENMHHLSPTPKRTIKGKVQPIEQFRIYTQEERNQIYQHEQHPNSESSDAPTYNIESLLEVKKSFGAGIVTNSSRLKSERPTALSASKRIIREEINEIINELDTNISLLNVNLDEINSLSAEKQSEVKTKLLQFHNFTFNRLILQERSTCTEKALLMRRFHKFYNKLIGDIPSLNENIQKFTSDYNQKYDSLLKFSKENETVMNNYLSENKQLKEEIEKLKNEIQELTESNNQKDIQISSRSFDLDMIKCQTTQFQFKIKKKKDKIKILKQSIEKIEEENKNYINQIENLTQSVNEFKKKEASANSLYQSEIAKSEQLQAKIKKLEKVNFTLTHIEKVDKNAQTEIEEQPPPNKTAPNRLLPRPTKKNRRNSLSSLQKSSKLPKNATPNDKIKGQKVDLSNKANFSRSTPLKLNENTLQTESEEKDDKKPSFSQTQHISNHISHEDPITIENKKVTSDEENDENPIEKVEIIHVEVEVQTDMKEEPKVPKSAPKSDTQNEKKASEKVTKYSQFKNPNRYDINHTKVDQLPDMFDIIMPFLSFAYVSCADQELKVINASYTSHKSDKHVVWAIQLIHSFLTDSFVRALKNQEHPSTESIFVEWISLHYGLPHLVQQAITDFTSILLNNRYNNAYLSFFTEVLMGKYSFAQLCFLSTIYTFSHELTFPNIGSLLQSLTFDLEKQPMIHIECVEKLITNCFSSEIAAKFVAKEFKTNFEEENPLVSFLDFLRKSTVLFGEQHRSLYSKSKDLLLLCGCFDCSNISYECFVKFFTLLGFGMNIKIFSSKNGFDGYCELFENIQFEFKEEWKRALKRAEKNDDEHGPSNVLSLHGILSVCAEKKRPLVRLLELESLKASVGRFKNLSAFISDFYFALLWKYASLLPRVLAKLSGEISAKVERTCERLRLSLLSADVGAIVYNYRVLMNRIDGLLMEEKGFIPFNASSTPEIIEKLAEYVERTESVSFVLIE